MLHHTINGGFHGLSMCSCECILAVSIGRGNWGKIVGGGGSCLRRNLGSSSPALVSRGIARDASETSTGGFALECIFHVEILSSRSYSQSSRSPRYIPRADNRKSNPHRSGPRQWKAVAGQLIGVILRIGLSYRYIPPSSYWLPKHL